MTKHHSLILLLFLGITFATHALAQERWFGDWALSVSVDPFDDSEQRFITSVPLNSNERDSVVLALACFRDGLNVVIYWGRYFGGDSNDRVRVRYRFDDLPASSEQLWEMLDDSEAAWMPMNRVDEFVRTARNSRSVLIRVVDPLDNDTITSETRLNGLNQALDALLPCSQPTTRYQNRPSNDDFANATLITGSNGRTTGSNSNATRESNEPSNLRDVAVWWRWTAPQNGTYTFDTAGSDFDTFLAVYTGTRLGATDFTTIASNDDADNLGTRSRVTITARAGTTYHIAVSGYGGATGTINLNWAQTRTTSTQTTSPATGTTAGTAGPSVGSNSCVTQRSGSCTVSFGAWAVAVRHVDGERRVKVTGRPLSIRDGLWFKPDYQTFGDQAGDFVFECQGNTFRAYAAIAGTMANVTRIDAEWRFSNAATGTSATWSRRDYRLLLPNSQLNSVLREARNASSGDLSISLIGIQRETVSIPVRGLPNALEALHCMS